MFKSAVALCEALAIKVDLGIRTRAAYKAGDKDALKALLDEYKLCVEKVEKINYLDTAKLKKYITEKGKILPRRMTGTCAQHQRAVASAIKVARLADLLPFKGE